MEVDELILVEKEGHRETKLRRELHHLGRSCREEERKVKKKVSKR